MRPRGGARPPRAAAGRHLTLTENVRFACTPWYVTAMLPVSLLPRVFFGTRHVKTALSSLTRRSR